MKRFFAIFGGLVFLLLVVVVGLLAWVLTFDANENKDWIAEKFREQTGRELVLGGNIDVSVYPWLGLNADDVSIGNDTGFSDTPLVHAEHLEFRVKLLPLLSREVEIDTVVIDGMHLNLEVAGNGRNNWATLAGNEQASATVTTESDSAEPPFNKLIIGGVRINNTSLVYDDRFAGTHYEINDFNMDIAELVYGDPLDIDMSMAIASSNPALDADVNLEGTALYDVDNGRYDLDPLQLDATLRGANVPDGSAELSLRTALNIDVEAETMVLDDLRFEALGTELSARINARRILDDTPAFDAVLDVDGEDLAVIFRILEQPELAQRIASLESSFTLSTTLEGDMAAGTVSLPRLTAALLDSDIEATLELSKLDAEAPMIAGNISASGPDLPTLVEVVGMLQGGRNSPLSQYGRELASVANKSYRVQTQFEADLEQSTASVPELYMNLLGATITGNLQASNFEDPEQLSANGTINAQGPDLPLLLQIAGQVSGDATLAGYGSNLRSSVRNRAFDLSADFDADMARGNIRVPTLNASMLGFAVNGNLTARDIQGDDGFVDGELSLTGENMREVLTAFEQPELAEVMRSVSLEVALGGSSSNLRLSPFTLRTTLAGDQIPDSPQTLTLEADSVMDLDAGNLRMDSFNLNGLGLDLNGSVEATDLRGAMSFSGRINLPVFNARRFMNQINQPLPPMTDETTLQRVGLTSAFGGTAGSFNLNDLQLTLDESTITGSLAITDLETRATQFTVNIDRIDADRYMSPATTAPESDSAETGPLPVDELRALNIDGSLNIGALTVNRLAMQDIVLELTASGGDIALYPFRADLYEGRFEGDIRLNVKGATPTSSVNTTLSGVRLGALLRDFADSAYVSGTGDIQLSLQGSGEDTAAIKRSLNGNGRLEMTDGVLNGVDVAAVLTRVETMIRARQVMQLPQGGNTPFEESAASLAIRNGVIRTDDMIVKAPGWQLTGNGTLLDLGSDMIDFRMLVEVDETTAVSEETEYDLGGYSLPIACTGSSSSPRCLPDAQQIIRAAVTNAVRDRLGDLLRDLGGERETPPQGQQQQ